MQLDDNLKNLLRELGHAINDTVSESERITGAIAGVRAQQVNPYIVNVGNNEWLLRKLTPSSRRRLATVTVSLKSEPGRNVM